MLQPDRVHEQGELCLILVEYIHQLGPVTARNPCKVHISLHTKVIFTLVIIII